MTACGPTQLLLGTYYVQEPSLGRKGCGGRCGQGGRLLKAKSWGSELGPQNSSRFIYQEVDLGRGEGAWSEGWGARLSFLCGDTWQLQKRVPLRRALLLSLRVAVGGAAVTVFVILILDILAA